MNSVVFDTQEAFVPGKSRIKYGGAFTDQKDLDAIWSVLRRNWWTIAEEGKNLESELSTFTNTRYATLTNSGSSALLIAYASLGLEPGSEIITGAVQFPTAISSMYYNNLVPVFVDVESETFGLDPDLIEKAITHKTKAILVVAIAGSVPNIEKILEVAHNHKLITILDNCDGFGGTWNGKPLEAYFDISATSFHAAHIMAMGEGGAVFTNIPEYGEKVASMREWGRLGGYDNIDANNDGLLDGIPSDYPARYLFVHMGFNVKPLELQCAMGRTQLMKLPQIKELRQKNFDILYWGLQQLETDGYIKLPRMYIQASASWFAFPMFATNRGELRDFLEKSNIETRTIFGGNITKQPAFRKFGRVIGGLPNADEVMNFGMFVSVHPDNTPEMMQFVVKSIKDFYNGKL